MRMNFRLAEVAVILAGLVGIILYWLAVDAHKFVLSGSIAAMGIIQIANYFRMENHQRTNFEKLRMVTALAIIGAAIVMPFTQNNFPVLFLILLFIGQQFAKRDKIKKQTS